MIHRHFNIFAARTPLDALETGGSHGRARPLAGPRYAFLNQPAARWWTASTRNSGLMFLQPDAIALPVFAAVMAMAADEDPARSVPYGVAIAGAALIVVLSPHFG